MKPITRYQFLDQSWDAPHLDAARQFWLQLYDAAAKAYGYFPNPGCALEIRLSGIPAREIVPLYEELERRVADSGSSGLEVSCNPPDGVVLSSGVADPAALPPG